MGNMMIASICIILINVLMFFSQAAMTSMNPGGLMCYSLDGSIIGNQLVKQNATAISYDNGVVNNSVINDLPSASTSTVNPSSSGGFVTDLFNNILSWLKSVPGLNYIINIVAAPYNILKCMNLPWEVTAGLGTLWYMLSLLALISFMWWRD
jgi:hypothetical protein